MRSRSSVLAGALALVAAGAQTGHAQDTPVTLYVAGTAGGGINITRAWWRAVSTAILPGKLRQPAVQVMPSTAAVRAANYLAEPRAARHTQSRPSPAEPILGR